MNKKNKKKKMQINVINYLINGLHHKIINKKQKIKHKHKF